MRYNPSFSHHILNKSSKDRYYRKNSYLYLKMNLKFDDYFKRCYDKKVIGHN